MAASGGTFTGNVSISDNAIEFDSDSSNSFKISIQGASSLSGNTTFTLPSADGSANQFLKTDGSGALSFATALTALSADTSPTLGASLSTNGFNIQFPDSTGANVNRASFGSGNDLQIYHDATDSKITNITGNLIIEAKTSETAIIVIPDGAVELYHNNSKKFETTSSGCKITGNLTGNDNHGLLLGTSQDFRIRHTGSHSEITDEGTGDLRLGSNRTIIMDAGLSTNQARFVQNGAVELYHSGSKKIETTSSGVTVTGTVTETSDIAYKSDIKPITNTLDKIQQITGYKYKLDNASIDSMGVIAQDVEKVYPELVHGDEGNKTLQYSGLIGVLVEAVKDLSAKVKKLESN